MKPFVIINRKAGSVSSEKLGEQIRGEFRKHETEADIRIVEGAQIAETVDAGLSSDADVIVSAGGDGTLKTIVEKLMGKEKPLGILPLGTLNHLARNLGIPLSVSGAVQAIIKGHVLSVDIGQVNSEVFTCDSIIGIPTYAMYASEHRRGNKTSRILELARMTLKEFRRFPQIEMEISSGGKTIQDSIPFLLVANSRYEFAGLNFTDRGSLQSGKLTVYIPRTESRAELFSIFTRAVGGNIEKSEHLEIIEGQEVSISMRKRSIQVALDGEFKILDTPLHYRSIPRLLRVYAPVKGEL